MQIPTLDLKAQFWGIESEVRAAIDRVLDTQHFILGPEVAALEQEMALHAGAPHAVAVSSGTDALLAALMALGIGPGDEVITTPYTFFATAGTIHRLGARPVFADIELERYNIDPDGIDSLINDRTRAIMPVHLFGICADMDVIMEKARKAELPVIEDAAQSIGATCSAGVAGTIGALGCLSFFPSKNLGGIGDGGMVLARDPQLAERLRILRNHGAKPKYWHHVVGGNFRLDAINAAVLRVKLGHLERWTERRRALADRYATLFEEHHLVGDDGPVLAVPGDHEGKRHVYNQYVVRVRDRDALQMSLTEHGIGTAVYYPHPLHLQPCFQELGYEEGQLPRAEQASRETLALPLYPELGTRQQDEVVAAMAAFYRG